MPTRIDVTPESALFLVHDAETEPPTVEGGNRGSLEREAAAGRVFFLATEDPIRFVVDVYVGEAPPAEQDDFEPLGGSFRLDVPSGHIKVSGGELAAAAAGSSIPVPPGHYILTVMGRRPFDGKRHEADMIALLGESDWRFSNRANWLGLLGCLPAILAIGALLAAIRRGRWIAFVAYAVPLLILAWLPHLFLRWSARYRRIQRAMTEHEGAKPLFILALTPSEQAQGLSGGFLNV